SLASRFFGRLLGFLLHAQRIGFSLLGRQSRLFRILTAPCLCFCIRASLRLTIQRRSLLRRHRRLCIVLGFLLDGHYARLFRRFHRFTRRRFDSLLIALRAVRSFGGPELLLGLRHHRWRILVRQRDVGDSHRVARLKELQRRLAVDPENRVLNF